VFTGIRIHPRRDKPPPDHPLTLEELKKWAQTQGLYIPEYEGNLVYGFCDIYAESTE